jgi:prepilin-type N-terminal cleavage/methylation domain-containing protein
MRQHGFSIVEMIVAIALMVTIAGVAIALVDPARARFVTQLESTDMQQRLRVAAGVLYKDLVMAGAGAYQSGNRGPLSRYFAAVLPYRQGTNHDDPAGTFKTDTITVMYVPSTAAQTTLATSGPRTISADIGVNNVPGCPADDPACGFKNGMAALFYDAAGDYDTFTVTDVQSNLLHVERGGRTLTYGDYQPDTTTVVQLASIVYSLKSDSSTDTYQLISREGGTMGADVPVVDHVVALRFVYYGDPQPPLLIKSLDDPVGPWTTYGPPPPTLLQQTPTGGYPPGENCIFTVDSISGLQVPRLPILASERDNALVHLTGAQLTDGPWCPDAASANRWDADLLRVRGIGVTIRVESANAALRGPASALFAHGGTSKSGNKWLPDLEVTFHVTPRNLGR